MWRSRMFWQLFGSYAVLVLSSLGLLGYVAANQMERNELSDIEGRLQDKALLLREVLRDHDASRERLLIERLGRVATPLPMRVTLIADDGRVLAETSPDLGELTNHADRPEVRTAQREGMGRAVRYSITLHEEMMYLALRSDLPASEVAFIRVACPLSSVQAHMQELRRLLWLAAGATALLALALAFWLARGITRPLAELTHGAEQIAAGAYGHRIYAEGSNEAGQLARTFNHMSDRLAEQFAQLEEDRQQLRTVLSSMVEGVIAIDPAQRILFANERAGQLLDFPVASALGRPLWEVVRQKALQELLRDAGTGAEFFHRELPWDGRAARSVSVHIAHLPGPPPRGAVLVFHDNTELRRLERLRHEFVANVSHELKTPLAIIQACVETLIDGAIEDPEHRGRFLEQIASEGQRLHDLIVDLLQLARIESETEAFSCEALDIEKSVQDCLQRHHTLAEGKNQRLEALEPSTGAPPVCAWADEEAVRQILDNLVNNALKYTPNGGRVSVRWRLEEQQVILEVEDSGIGIAAADLPRIFERFYRVDKARSRELGGTGLGLSIVKHLVQAMRGSLRADSQPGRGTTFTIVLPAAPD
jgi:two-component system, OmpR family, phosphate regulon sensor histidine kinase PhoR